MRTLTTQLGLDAPGDIGEADDEADSFSQPRFLALHACRLSVRTRAYNAPETVTKLRQGLHTNDVCMRGGGSVTASAVDGDSCALEVCITDAIVASRQCKVGSDVYGTKVPTDANI